MGTGAKRKYDPYLLDGSAAWVKIRNREYSQWTGREELFERDRSADPEWEMWSRVAAAGHVIEKSIWNLQVLCGVEPCGLNLLEPRLTASLPTVIVPLH